MMFSILLVIVICVSVWLLFGRKKHPIDQLPGPPTRPFIGNALDFAVTKEELLDTLQKFSFKYWPTYRVWLLQLPVIHPHDPDDLEVIFSSSKNISKSHEYNTLLPWLGTGLLTSTGSKWHSRRKLLTPAFHFKILEEFLPVFSDNSAVLISKLCEHVSSTEGVDIVPLITHCALDVICETAMGIKLNSQKDSDSEYVTALHELNAILVYRSFRPWLLPDCIFNLTPSSKKHDRLVKVIHNFTDEVISKRKEQRKLIKLEVNEPNPDVDIGSKKRIAFLDLLLRANEEQGNLSDQDIREEVNTFMFEGHDTTAMAMSWMLLFLGWHQDIQEKCWEELSEIFGDSDRLTTWADLGAMKYMERFIKEAMRIRPSVYFIGRKLDVPMKLRGIEYPAGTIVTLNLHSFGRNPEIFPDPEKFDPDRFLPENCAGRHPYAYLPFSAGPRNCIGQKFAMSEMKCILSNILRNFRLTAVNPERDFATSVDLICRPRFGINLTLQPRTLH